MLMSDPRGALEIHQHLFEESLMGNAINSDVSPDSWKKKNVRNLIRIKILRCLLYSFSNVCRDFTICFPQNILDQGDIQMRDLKFHALAFMSLQFAAYGRFNCLAFQMCFLLLSRMTFTSH